MLQEQVFAHLQTAPTPDLSAECTTALVQLMLAQAQECFCIKAAKGGRGLSSEWADWVACDCGCVLDHLIIYIHTIWNYPASVI